MSSTHKQPIEISTIFEEEPCRHCGQFPEPPPPRYATVSELTLCIGCGMTLPVPRIVSNDGISENSGATAGRAEIRCQYCQSLNTEFADACICCGKKLPKERMEMNATVTGKLSAMFGRATRMIVWNPWKAVLFALGMGILLGSWLEYISTH